MVPINEYEALLTRARASTARDQNLIPNEVVTLMFEGEGMGIARAWREHLNLTQAEVAERMGISQAALAQMESAANPRKATRAKLATAFGISEAQLLA